MKKIFATLAALTFTLSANAGFLFQPSVGYDVSSSTSVTTIADVTSEYTNSGTAFGALVGYKFGNGILLGADYAGGSGKSKNKAVGSTEEFDTTSSAASAVLGFSKNRFSAYLGYGVQDSVTLKDASSETKYTGTNVKVGLGVVFVKYFGMSVEYIKPTYTKVTTGGTEYTLSDLYSKMDASSIRVNLIFPFEFGK